MSIGLGQPLYAAQGVLSPTYLKPYANHYWKTAYFNDTHGKEIAEFNMAFRGTNASLGPVLVTVSFSPNFDGSVQLDSVRLTFASDSFANWPDIGARVPLQTGSLAPAQIVRGDQGKVTINYQALGTLGLSTNDNDLWFGPLGVGRSSNTNHTVTLTVDVTAHNTRSILIGQSYSGEATFPIIFEPNGLVFVSERQ